MSEAAEKMESFSILAYMSPLAVVWLIPTTMILDLESPMIARQLIAKIAGFSFLLVLSCTVAFFANVLKFWSPSPQVL